jgi:cardiolipin synthase
MSRHKRSRFSKLNVVAVSVMLTLAVVVIALNLAIGEKQITEEVRRLYSIEDPQFARTMGVALGPAIVGGNRFRALQAIRYSAISRRSAAPRRPSFGPTSWSDDIGKEFAEISRAGQAGVRVHVMIDWSAAARSTRASSR